MTEESIKKKRKPFFTTGSFDIQFFIISLILLTVGLIMLFSASYAYSLQYKHSSFAVIKQQLICAVIGVAVMFFVSKINYIYLKTLTLFAYFGVIGLLVLVLILPPDSKGFHRWIDLGFVTIQPSDLAKIAIIMSLALYMSMFYDKMRTFKYGFVAPAMIFGVICILVILEKHVSATILLGLIGLIMMYIGGTKKRYFFIIAIAAVLLVAAVFIIPQLSYAEERILSFFDKSASNVDERWQVNNSLKAIGSGGLFGVGLGNSKQKYLYVSEPQNDFIFSIVCEELGFIGASAIIGMFIFFIYRGCIIATKAPDKFSSLLVSGVMAHVGVQVLLNILVVSDSIPNTGIALPFFSSGGTALIALLIEVGIVLSVSRQASIKRV